MENAQSEVKGTGAASLRWCPPPPKADGLLVLADGLLFWGRGFGAAREVTGELCFNTSMTGYQEVITDPSYAAQLITFTAPHIGNVGVNDEDDEADTPACRGVILREAPRGPSSWRAERDLGSWLAAHERPGLSGVDTRRLTTHIRTHGAIDATLAWAPGHRWTQAEVEALWERARRWGGLAGRDLASEYSGTRAQGWDEGLWRSPPAPSEGAPHVVLIDYGVKSNILRSLRGHGARVSVVAADASAAEILSLQPDGICLSNGPGDPAATVEVARETLTGLLSDEALPLFGICLGHQLLALSLGAKTEKMHQGHRGANHPVIDLETGRVEITSQNHGFAVNELPEGLEETHRSLFDGSNAGIRLRGRPVRAVQFHPEASPGPHDSQGLFARFVEDARQYADARGSAAGGDATTPGGA